MHPSPRLADYDDRWPQEFEQIRSSLFDATAGLVPRIEHIGATAVPRLAARPIIDVLAGVDREADAAEADNLIVGLNFREVPTDGLDARVKKFVRPRHGDSTHTVYLVELETHFWDRALRFRDLLRESQRDAWRYASFRRVLCDVFADQAEAYEEAKQVFIRSVLDG